MEHVDAWKRQWTLPERHYLTLLRCCGDPLERGQTIGKVALLPFLLVAWITVDACIISKVSR